MNVTLLPASTVPSGKTHWRGRRRILMFYTEDKTRLRQAMRTAGLGEVRFKFDFEGTTTVVTHG